MAKTVDLPRRVAIISFSRSASTVLFAGHGRERCGFVDATRFTAEATTLLRLTGNRLALKKDVERAGSVNARISSLVFW